MSGGESDEAAAARRARWLLRELPEVTLRVDATTATCPLVCSREGEPMIELPAGARPAPQAAGAELEAQGGDGRQVRLRGVLRTVEASEAIERFEAFFPHARRIGLRRLELADASARDPELGELGIAPGSWQLRRPGWVDQEGFIIDHMNADHVAEMRLMCRHFHGVDDPRPRMRAVDPEGMHVSADARVLYFRFDAYCDSLREVAGQTILLTRRAGGATPSA